MNDLTYKEMKESIAFWQKRLDDKGFDYVKDILPEHLTFRVNLMNYNTDEKIWHNEYYIDEKYPYDWKAERIDELESKLDDLEFKFELVKLEVYLNHKEIHERIEKLTKKYDNLENKGE